MNCRQTQDPRGKLKMATELEILQPRPDLRTQEWLKSLNDRFYAICLRFWRRLRDQSRKSPSPADLTPHTDSLDVSPPPRPGANLEHSQHLITPPAKQKSGAAVLNNLSSSEHGGPSGGNPSLPSTHPEGRLNSGTPMSHDPNDRINGPKARAPP
ncbi:Hypothetical predicted protein [Pelobates cultripes]|uniref:Uncharacterized protein n=1 Tax=Pelobates cultripes TaxID=61616 RepID=A0AAD1STQ6_PELCU|nr:Hypothetical predicted protein [Pelobates cultripes]